MTDKNYGEFEILDVTDSITMNDIEDGEIYSSNRQLPVEDNDEKEMKLKKSSSKDNY